MAQKSQSKLVVPHCIELPEGLEPGNKLRIKGSVPRDGVSFMVNFLCGKQEKANNALLIVIKLEPPSVVMLNSFVDNTLGEKEKYTNVPFTRGQKFELVFVVEEDVYKVLVNGKDFCQWKHRISAKKVHFVQIEGNVELQAADVEQPAVEEVVEMVQSAPAAMLSCYPCPTWHCRRCCCTPCRCAPCCRCCCSPCRCGCW